MAASSAAISSSPQPVCYVTANNMLRCFIEMLGPLPSNEDRMEASQTVAVVLLNVLLVWMGGRTIASREPISNELYAAQTALAKLIQANPEKLKVDRRQAYHTYPFPQISSSASSVVCYT